jgi:5-methylcytosine-specific restriction endonuclease McrBC regulatory subunit McrC
MLRNILLSDYSEVTTSSIEERNVLELAFKKIQASIDNGEIKINGGSKYNQSSSEKLFEYVNGKLYTQGLVGVIKTTVKNINGEIENVNIVIKSRFDKNHKKPYFLAKMLQSANLFINDQISDSIYEDLFDFLLVGLFKNKFTDAYQHGLFKKYITIKESSFKPKGNINFSEYIKNISSGKEQIPYTYSERSIFNSINKLILLAYNVLKRNFPDQVEKLIDSSEVKNNLDVLRSELSYFKEDINQIIKGTNRPISHPYFSVYEDLRTLCLSILRFEGISPFDQESGETEAILYYIPNLWEEYLELNFFQPKIYRDFEVQFQAELKVLNEINKSDDSVNRIDIRPDFVIFNRTIPIAILDAKFKPKWSNEIDLDDYTKCVRDMNAFNANITGVIYPTNSGVNLTISTYRISQYNQRDIFFRIPVVLPEIKEQNFNEFSQEMNENVSSISKNLNQQFRTLLNN